MPLLDHIGAAKQHTVNISGLLAKPSDRFQRNREKIKAVLRFLRTSIYSTPPILGEVMGIKAPSGISQTLRLMEKKSLIRRHTFPGTQTLWGITAVGQEAAMQNGDEPINVVFNTSKVSLRNLEHYLSIQLIRARAEKQNWSDFIYCDRRALDQTRTDETINEPQRPDLLATDLSGRRVAIESERTLKRLQRYKESVIPGHVRRLNAEEYQYIVWVCQDIESEKALRRLLASALQELSNENALHLELTTPNVKTFNVTNLASWPKF